MPKILMATMLATAALVSDGENYYFNNPGKSGFFEDPDNWMIANRPAQGCPDKGDDIYCTNDSRRLRSRLQGRRIRFHPCC